MTVEGQIARMQKLHSDIRRLNTDMTNSIDDISRYISMQYMKKKTNEIRSRTNALKSGIDPATITSVRNLSLKQGQDADLFNTHPAIHNYGKIDPSEKNFESLGKQANDRASFGERSAGQINHPL